jgi:hypothetical protein
MFTNSKQDGFNRREVTMLGREKTKVVKLDTTAVNVGCGREGLNRVSRNVDVDNVGGGSVPLGSAAEGHAVT